ncbi:MAG: hypothetical protein AB9M53_08280 [Leptothrix sp. (in: b-proteobacteria)]
MRSLKVLSVMLAVSGWHAIALADGSFEVAKVVLERNVTDKDSEARIEAIGAGAALASLKVVAPDGRTVVDYKATDSKLGMRHFTFESPEPNDSAAVQVDFPVGAYVFTGTTVTGEQLQGSAMLTHAFPAAATLLRPLADARNVSTRGLRVVWKPVKGAAAQNVVIEDEASGREVNAKLSGAASSFVVPDGFLQPGIEYKVAVGTIAQDGNSSYVEAAFTTAK